jgi:hypothetical protein
MSKSLEEVITKFLSENGLDKSLESPVQKLVNECFEVIFKIIYNYQVPDTKENDEKVLKIQLIMAKFIGYKKCMAVYGLNENFDKDDELRVIRDFCDSEEEFQNYLKVIDKYEPKYGRSSRS